MPKTMTPLKSLISRAAWLAGLDTLEEKYAYGHDQKHGFMAAEKIPDTWTKTTCGYCSVGCGMEIGVKDGRAVSVRGDETHPVNRGKLCPKGLSEHYILDAHNRATHPLRKNKNGRLSPIGWDDALQEMATTFRATIQKHGPGSVAVIGTGQLLSEEFYALGKLVRLGIGAAHNDGNTTLCMASAVAGYKRSFGSDGPPGAYDDLEKADVILLVGANIADNHPILCHRMAQNPGAFVIVVDPRVSKTAMMANLHLPIKSRTDVQLINGLLGWLMQENRLNQDFIDAHTEGFAVLKKFLRGYGLEEAARDTGVGLAELLLAARHIAQAKSLFIGWTMGVNHSTQGTETVNALCNLSLALGQIGKPGAAPFSITGQCNAMGTREGGFTASMPGYRAYDNPEHRRELANLWNVPIERLPTARGLAYPDIIEAVLRREIKNLWIIGTNPLVSFPNQNMLRQALEDLSFLVVQDGFHPTPTSELAHLLLPAAIWGEKEGVMTNSERRVSKFNKAVNPPGEALSDFEIFLRLAAKLGCREEIFPGWEKPEDAFNEWRKVSEGRLCDYSGISYDLLQQNGPVQWPLGRGEAPVANTRLYADGQFQHPGGKAKFWVVKPEAMPETPSEEYTLLLNTGRTVEHWHTRTKTKEVPILEKLSPEAWVEINPANAAPLGLKQGDYARLVSPRGVVERIAVRLTQIVPPGQVFVPFHFHEANVNHLTLNLVCPISREPNFKQCAVRVEALSANPTKTNRRMS